MDENLDGIDVEEDNEDYIEEEQAIEMPVEKHVPVIEVADVENPSWVSMYQPFLDMVRTFVENDLKSVPSITYESMVNYLATVVDGICKQKIVGTPSEMIQSKVQVGMVDGVLSGFQVFSMLANRLPHVQSMNYPYIYSQDIRVTHAFLKEAARYQKKWKARYIIGTAVSKRLNRALKKVFGGYSEAGTYFVARDVKYAIGITKHT